MNRVGSMLTLFFTEGPVTDYATAKASDTARFGRFFRAMRERGVFLPAQFEAVFVSPPRRRGHRLTVAAAAEAFRAVAPPDCRERRRGTAGVPPATGPPRSGRPGPSCSSDQRYARSSCAQPRVAIAQFAPRTTSPGSGTENRPPSVSALAGT